MKSKRYIKKGVYFLSLAILMFGCDNEVPGPPPVENQPPVISGLNDISLPLDFGTYELDFANYVSDQEGEIISYLVSNSSDTVITISLDFTVLTITEVGTGPSEIIVIATDGHEGHEVVDTFTVTVRGIWGAPDYTGNVMPGFLDFNGYGTGSIFENRIPGLKVEGYTGYDWESGDFGVMELAHDDHLLIVNNIDGSWIWTEYRLDDSYDFTGKKFRFDYSYFTAPTLTGTHWWEPDEVVDEAAVDIRLYFVNSGWSTGGAIYFSGLNLEYSTDWQSVEIPLADFGSLWSMPVDVSNIRYYGLEIWGGNSGAPLSFRLDNFGIVD